MRPTGNAVLPIMVLLATACTENGGPSPDSAPTHPTGLTLTSTVVTERPFGIAVSKAGIVYVTRLDAGAITRLNLATGAIEGTVAVGVVPTDVTFDDAGATAYVTNQASDELGTITVSSSTQTAGLPIRGTPFRVKIQPGGARLFVSSNSDSVFAVNPVSNTITARIGVGLDPNGLAFNPDGSRLWVGNQSDGTVSEVNTSTNTVIRTITVGGTPQEVVLSPDGATLYVANLASGVQFVNLSTLAVTQLTIDQGVFSLALTPDGTQLYAGATLTGKVYIIDRASQAIALTLAVGGAPRRIAFSRRGDVAVIANEAGSVTFVR